MTLDELKAVAHKAHQQMRTLVLKSEPSPILLAMIREVEMGGGFKLKIVVNEHIPADRMYLINDEVFEEPLPLKFDFENLVGQFAEIRF